MSTSQVGVKVAAAAGASIVSAITSFLDPVTEILRFAAAVIALVAGIYAIRVSRKNLKK